MLDVFRPIEGAVKIEWTISDAETIQMLKGSISDKLHHKVTQSEKQQLCRSMQLPCWTKTWTVLDLVIQLSKSRVDITAANFHQKFRVGLYALGQDLISGSDKHFSFGQFNWNFLKSSFWGGTHTNNIKMI